MKTCSRCGAPVADFDKFCQECGNPMPVSEDPSQDERLYGRIPEQAAKPQTAPIKGKKQAGYKEPKQPISLKPSKSFVKGLICGLAIMVAVIIAMVGMNAMTFNAARTAYSQVEGVGYRSADEAVKAYAQAFAEKDYEKMLSTFAVETYVENFDLAAQIDRMKAYNPTFTINLPNDNGFVGEILRQNRVSEINSMISYEYLQVTGIADKLGDDIVKAIYQGFDSGADLIDTKLSGGRHFDDLTIEVGTIMMPDTLTDKYSTEGNLGNLERIAKVYGADQIENRAVELTVNGEKYLLCMECVCYNGKWFNETLNGNLAMILGMNNYIGGLAPVSKLDY